MNFGFLFWVVIMCTKRLKYIVIFKLIFSMVQGPSWEACWFEASEEISRNPKAHYHTQSVPHLSLSCTSQIESLKPHSTWIYIIILFNLLLVRLPSGLLPSSSQPRPYTRYSPHPYAPHAQPISFFSIYHPHNIVWAVQIIPFPVIYPHVPLQTSLCEGLHPCRRRGSDRRHEALCCWYSSG